MLYGVAMTNRDAKLQAQSALADAIRAHLQRNSLTSKELGDKLDISEQYVGKLLSGRGWPSPGLLAKMRQLGIINVNEILDSLAA